MPELFSTELIPAPDRLAAWRSYASLVCGNSRFYFPSRAAFRGVIDRRSLGPLQLSHFSSTPVSFAKYPSVSTKAEDPGCVIISQLRGGQEYAQNGTRIELRTGDTTLIDAGQPWSSTCAHPGSRLYLRLPRWLVQEKLAVAKLPVLPIISGAFGLGATLFRLGSSLYKEAAVLTAEEGVAAIESYLHILSACISSGEGRQEVYEPGLHARVERFIEERLSDPGLTPAQISAQAGISVRHLHRLFLRKGETVMECIRRKRLEKCRAELGDPRLLQRNITDVAFSWGFSDSAHFSHCFKRQFGVSPREYRLRLHSGRMRPDDAALVSWTAKSQAASRN